MTPAEVEAKLRENAAETAQGWSDLLMIEAADALAAKEAEITRLRSLVEEAGKVVEPFALDPMEGQRLPVAEVICRGGLRRAITDAHYRAARSLITKLKEG